MANEVAKNSPPATVNSYIESMVPEIAKALSGSNKGEKEKRAQEFARIAITTVKKIPKLLECDPVTLAGALMECASFDMYPDPRGQVWLIPYKNKGKYEVQFQLGFKGMIELAYRSGEVKSIRAEVVYEAEIKAGMFDYECGLEERITHKRDLLNSEIRTGKVAAAYAVANMKNGSKFMVVIDRAQIEKRMNSSQSMRGTGAQYSPWTKWHEEMCKKTAIKALCKTLPQSIADLHRAAHHDDLREAGKATVHDDRLEIDSSELEFVNTDKVNAIIDAADTGEVKDTE